jgi:hypothetical protein
VRALGGQPATEANASDWLKYPYGGDPVRTFEFTREQQLQAIINCYLNRFDAVGILGRIPSGLKWMVGLIEFLKEAQRSPKGPEFQAIQRVTGEKTPEDFFESSAWSMFVTQIIDGPILEGRCLDGAYDALKGALKSIMAPELPKDLHGAYLWTEGMVQRYVTYYMSVFDFHLDVEDLEERTYGLPWLAWRVNPILKLSPEEKPHFHEGDYDHGRLTLEHCFQPFKIGQFPAEMLRRRRGSRTVGYFLNRKNKKNTTKAPSNQYELTYIAPFSPVKVFYHDGRELFSKCLSPTFDDVVEPYEEVACNTFMRLLFLNPHIRNEYLAFVAPFDARPVTDGQLVRWAPEDGTVVATSSGSLQFLMEKSQDALDQFNCHLRYWKLGFRTVSGGGQGFFPYPTFESWKDLALRLGYARETDEYGRDTDLKQLKYEPLVPDTVMDADGKPQLDRTNESPPHPDGWPYKQYNVWGERIDRPNVADNEKRQPTEPADFTKPFPWPEIDTRADPMQKLVYEVCFPKNKHFARIAEHEQELAKIKEDLRRWNELIQKEGSEDLTNAEVNELTVLFGKYPGDAYDLPRRIASLEIEWCGMKLELNPARKDKDLYGRLKEANADLIAWHEAVGPDGGVLDMDKLNQLSRKYPSFSRMSSDSVRMDIQKAIIEIKCNIVNDDERRWDILLNNRRHSGTNPPEEVEELDELQRRYQNKSNIRIIKINLAMMLNGLRRGSAVDANDPFFP